MLSNIKETFSFFIHINRVLHKVTLSSPSRSPPTSVSCAVWPKCYHVLNWFSLLKRGLLEFIWIFSDSNHLQINVHSESQSYKTNSIRSCSSRSFHQHQRHIPIPLKFSATTLFNFQWSNHSILKNFKFQWRNHSIFKNFCTASPNAMEPSLCTPYHPELSKDTDNRI